MIFFNGIYSVLEALYLQDSLTDILIDSGIVVNPSNSSYLYGKTIILNQPDLDLGVLDRLLRSGSKVISRIPGYDSKIPVIPYLEKPIFNILWNGRVLKDLSDLDDSGGIEVDWPRFYFPKILNPGKVLFQDCPSALGYLLFQVGQDNMINNKLFSDLDIEKCKKGCIQSLGNSYI